MTALGIKLVKHWVTRPYKLQDRTGSPAQIWKLSAWNFVKQLWFFFHSGLFKPWRLSTPGSCFFGQNSWWPPGLLVVSAAMYPIIRRQTAGYLRIYEKNNKLPNNEMIGAVAKRRWDALFALQSGWEKSCFFFWIIPFLYFWVLRKKLAL